MLRPGLYVGSLCDVQRRCKYSVRLVALGLYRWYAFTFFVFCAVKIYLD